jgi:hypothetical protein
LDSDKGISEIIKAISMPNEKHQPRREAQQSGVRCKRVLGARLFGENAQQSHNVLCVVLFVP